GHETALAVARVAVGVVGIGAEDTGLAGLLVELHDPVVRDVGEQQIAALREIDRTFGPAQPGRDLLERRGIEPVLRKARIEDLDGGIRIALRRREWKRLGAGSTCEKRRSRRRTSAGQEIASRETH